MSRIAIAMLSVGWFLVAESAVALTREEGASIQAMWWAKNTRWESHIKTTMYELFTCRAAEPDNDRSPCNFFAGRILNNVYGVSDFLTPTGYLAADAMVTAVYRPGSLWKEIGDAGKQANLRSAQDLANQGYAVVALYPSVSGRPGHVALIIPGQLKPSSTWKMEVPNSASFFLDKPDKSYVGKGLSVAFSVAKKGDVRMFYRVGSNIR